MLVPLFSISLVYLFVSSTKPESVLSGQLKIHWWHFQPGWTFHLVYSNKYIMTLLSTLCSTSHFITLHMLFISITLSMASWSIIFNGTSPTTMQSKMLHWLLYMHVKQSNTYSLIEIHGKLIQRKTFAIIDLEVTWLIKVAVFFFFTWILIKAQKEIGGLACAPGSSIKLRLDQGTDQCNHWPFTAILVAFQNGLHKAGWGKPETKWKK